MNNFSIIRKTHQLKSKLLPIHKKNVLYGLIVQIKQIPINISHNTIKYNRMKSTFSPYCVSSCARAVQEQRKEITTNSEPRSVVLVNKGRSTRRTRLDAAGLITPQSGARAWPLSSRRGSMVLRAPKCRILRKDGARAALWKAESAGEFNRDFIRMNQF